MSDHQQQDSLDSMNGPSANVSANSSAGPATATRTNGHHQQQRRSKSKSARSSLHRLPQPITPALGVASLTAAPSSYNSSTAALHNSNNHAAASSSSSTAVAAPPVSSPLISSSPRRVLVTGGSGFLGRHLIQTLLGLGHTVVCYDIAYSSHDPSVVFYQGDISSTSEDDRDLLLKACQGIDTIFHTASLTDPAATYPQIHAVNVGGTKNLIAAALKCNVATIIYTSTTAVVFNGGDMKGLREDQCTYPSRYLDTYSHCKAEAERIIIGANGTKCDDGVNTLCTVSLRPHAIFGPRDTHFISKLIARARTGDITHMVGDGENLVDFTYVGNVIHAMIITMNQLSAPEISLTDPPDSSDELRIILAARKRCGGECYFITNGEPRSFWSFVNTILNETGCVGPTKKISFSIAYFIAWCMEWVQWWTSKLPSFLNIKIVASITRKTVCSMGRNQWYSCEKAARDLGYHPIISLDQGLETTINYFFRRTMTGVSMKQVKVSTSHTGRMSQSGSATRLTSHPANMDDLPTQHHHRDGPAYHHSQTHHHLSQHQPHHSSIPSHMQQLQHTPPSYSYMSSPSGMHRDIVARMHSTAPASGSRSHSGSGQSSPVHHAKWPRHQYSAGPMDEKQYQYDRQHERRIEREQRLLAQGSSHRMQSDDRDRALSAALMQHHHPSSPTPSPIYPPSSSLPPSYPRIRDASAPKERQTESYVTSQLQQQQHSSFLPPSSVVTPNPQRMKQVPSSLFLNAYSHTQIAPIVQPSPASSSTSGGTAAMLGSPPNFPQMVSSSADVERR